MCGISGIININNTKIHELPSKLAVTNHLLKHRGPDGKGIWMNQNHSAGLAHTRLSIIDLHKLANQPMCTSYGTVLVFNGEIYNYLELQNTLKETWRFKTKSDTETILAAYQKYNYDCIKHLRGMFSFALWNEKERKLFCARDRLGIKPFYYTVQDNLFIFASEVKALLPFLKNIETDANAFAQYITFQYTIGEQTLIKDVYQLLPGQALKIIDGKIITWQYWDIQYDIDQTKSSKYFINRLDELVQESIKLHLRSDVPIASYVSGGIDSSLIALIAAKQSGLTSLFHGKITSIPGYDESYYANQVSKKIVSPIYTIDITAIDLYENLKNIIYYLDFPVAGPGAFSQYMVSKLASQHVKVILGGQGGDELFGGYARYVLAYFEQTIKAAIEGTYQHGNFVVTPASIIPNLGVLKEYKPMIKEFWREGLFDPLDARYFRLSNRATDFKDEIDWSILDLKSVFEQFKSIFNNENNVQKEAYFDKMTHFDLKTLLPALLQVEDRMSMAHGLESRVPLLDHPLVEFAATVPADIKFADGKMKNLLKATFQCLLPTEILTRRDKMGFPVPLNEWLNGDLKGMLHDVLGTVRARTRPFINSNSTFYRQLDKPKQFSRKLWALLSLELWHQNVHDKHASYTQMLTDKKIIENPTYMVI